MAQYCSLLFLQKHSAGLQCTLLHLLQPSLSFSLASTSHPPPPAPPPLPPHSHLQPCRKRNRKAREVASPVDSSRRASLPKTVRPHLLVPPSCLHLVLTSCLVHRCVDDAVAPMMYGFGDENPAPDTISVMEELVIEHITDVVRSLAPSHVLSRAVLTVSPAPRRASPAFTIPSTFFILDPSPLASSPPSLLLLPLPHAPTLPFLFPSHPSQCLQAHQISTNRGKIKVDDFRFALRRDPKKLARLDELLFMQEEITRARRGFEDPSFMAGEEEEGVVGGAGASAPSKPPAGGAGDGAAAKKKKEGKGKGKA